MCLVCALIDGALPLIRIYCGTQSVEGGFWLSLGGNTSLDCIDIAIPFGCGNILKASTCRTTAAGQLSSFHTICIDSAPARLMRPLLVLHKRYACQTPVHMPSSSSSYSSSAARSFFCFVLFFLHSAHLPHVTEMALQSPCSVCAGCRLCCLIHAHYGLVVRRLHGGPAMNSSA